MSDVATVIRALSKFFLNGLCFEPDDEVSSIEDYFEVDIRAERQRRLSNYYRCLPRPVGDVAPSLTGEFTAAALALNESQRALAIQKAYQRALAATGKPRLSGVSLIASSATRIGAGKTSALRPMLSEES